MFYDALSFAAMSVNASLLTYCSIYNTPKSKKKTITAAPSFAKAAAERKMLWTLTSLDCCQSHYHVDFNECFQEGQSHYEATPCTLPSD